MKKFVLVVILVLFIILVFVGFNGNMILNGSF